MKSVLLFTFLFTTFYSAQITSAKSGDWNAADTWFNGVVPKKNESVVIGPGHIVYVGAQIERNASTTVNGVFQINPNGSVIGIPFTYSGTGSALVFNHGMGVYYIYDDTPFWPTVNGPSNVTINSIGGVNPKGISISSVTNVSRTVSRDFIVRSGVMLNNASLNLNGTTYIFSDGYFANTPVYGPASTLVYRTGGNYTVGNEWTGGGTNNFSAGAGIPQSITVDGGTNLQINGARGLAGNLSLQSSGVLTLGSNLGEDLYVKGNFTVGNTASFNPNNRTVVFCRTGSPASPQDITSANPLTLHYLKLSAPSGGAYVRMNSNLNITAPAEGDVVQFSNDADRLYLNNKTLTLGTPAKNNTISGTGSFVGTTAGTSDLAILGKGSIGTVKFAANSTLRNLTLARESGLVGAALGSDLTVEGNVNLQAGILDVYGYIMTLGSSAAVAVSAPAANNYIIADGDNGGALRKMVTNSFSSFTFPVGDSQNSANGTNYSPIDISINNLTTVAGAYLEVKVFNRKALDSDTNYLSRYWTLRQSGITNNFKYKVEAIYTDADVSGNESTFFNSLYDLGDNKWSQQGKTTASSNTISFTVGDLADLSKGDAHWITAGEKVRKREIIVRGNGIEISPGDSTPDFFDNTYFGTATDGKTIDKVFTIHNVGNAPLQVNSIVLTNNAGNPGAFTLVTTFTGQIAAGASANITVRFNAALPTGNKTATIQINNNDSIKPSYSFTLMGTVSSFITCNGFSILRVQNFETAPAYPIYSFAVTENIVGNSAIIAGGRAYANGQLHDKFQEGQSLQVFNAHSTVNFSMADLTASIDPYLVVNLAAFGYTNNEGPNNDDFVEISVSSDGIIWYPQIRLNAGTQTNWNFGLQTPEYSRGYSTGPASVINLGNGSLSSANVKYVVHSLPKVGTFYMKIDLKSGADAKIWALDNVMIVDNTSTKTWNGTAWTGVDAQPPNFSQKAIINANLTTTPATGFSTCECEVKSGAVFTVGGGSSVEVQGNIINNGQIIVESDGNLIQRNDSGTYTGSGAGFKARRAVSGVRNSLATGQHMDYIYWSSPVSGQGLKAFSPGTPYNRFYQYNETNDYFTPVNLTTEPNFKPAKGYAIRAEDGLAYGYSKSYEFTGTPNNGIKTIGIQRSPDAGTVQHGYNLIGNPYPSNISFDALHTANSGSIFKTAWFWINDDFTYYQTGSGYVGNGYAVYNGTGGNGGTTDTNPDNAVAPDGTVKVGQGFIVQMKDPPAANPPALANVTFNNSMRVSTAGTFYQKGSGKDRFWLKLISPSNTVNTQLIGYVDGATDGYEQDFDAESFGLSSDLFFSTLGDKRLIIQGKGMFSDTDKVMLGANFFKDGQYTIAIQQKEGIFAGGQNIYLKDTQTGMVTNLSEGAYTFSANKGVSEGRFEIIYQPQTILATGGTVGESITVYRDANDFVVRAAEKTIENLELYDAAGRLMLTVSGQRREVRFSADRLLNGLYVVKSRMKDGETFTKKIKK